MKITGIVTEYNPFHNGHRYHIEQTRLVTQCDVLVNVMSGNFVQRGEPAICDKWQRAKEGVLQGCDLVIELPFPYVCQSADQFAKGAITCLNIANVDALVFGSECNDIDLLQRYALLSKDDFLSERLVGESLAKAQTNLQLNVSSNDILGISYLRALKDTTITPYTIQRTNRYHDTAMTQDIASASAIRLAFQKQMDVTHTTPMAAQLTGDFLYEHYYSYIQTLLTTLSPIYLASLFLMDEGIEHQFIKQAKRCATLQDFVDGCISKRYTRSKIQRTLIHLLNQTTKDEMNALPEINYIRVLAYNDVGRQYLHKLKKEGVTIASKFAQIPQPYRQMELRACSAYSYPLDCLNRKQALDGELRPPVYINL